MISIFSATWKRELRCFLGVLAIGIVSFGVPCDIVGPVTLAPRSLDIGPAFGGVALGPCKDDGVWWSAVGDGGVACADGAEGGTELLPIPELACPTG